MKSGSLGKEGDPPEGGNEAYEQSTVICMYKNVGAACEVQLVERLPSSYKAPGLIPSST